MGIEIGMGALLIFYIPKGLTKDDRKFWTARWEYGMQICMRDTVENIIKQVTDQGWKYRVFRTHRSGFLTVLKSNEN